MHLVDIYNLDFIHKRLRNILKIVEDNFGPQIITSLYRIGDNGVHGTLPLRGIDLRCRNKDSGKIISDYINVRFIYDPVRPQMKVAIAHGNDSNYHIHIQVHQRTISKIQF